MSFKPGKVIGKFKLGKKEIIFRYPKEDDLDILLNYINSIIKERTYLSMQKPCTRKEEREFLMDTIKKMKKNDVIFVLAEFNGKPVGSFSLKRNELDAHKHTAEFGIAVKKGFRGMGLGAHMTNLAIKLAKEKMKLKIVWLGLTAENKTALHVYEKCGFKEVGLLPKFSNHYGKYIDSILMAREL
ncbi:MAG: GNAT family protein [Candidatus Aenigmarchaeota archaeon]